MSLTGDTIVAISTPIGRGAICIIRLSGPDSLKIADKIFTSSKGNKLSNQKGNTVLHGKISVNGAGIQDEGLAVIFKEPRSFTGEDMIEFNCHSNVILMNLILDAAIAKGARLAEPGEFSKRAYLNKKMDLFKAEGIVNLVNAKTRDGLRAASGMLSGEDKNLISEIVNNLQSILINVEAMIEFPEDGISEFDNKGLLGEFRQILNRLNRQVSKRSRSFLYSDGVRCCIAGKPNVGKSTLLNSLLNDERAIVSKYPGTTRDLIKEYIDIEGIPVYLTDTAGISDKHGEIEAIGIDKSIKAVKSSEVIIILLDGSIDLTNDDENIFEITDGKDGLVVINKSDLPDVLTLSRLKSLSKGWKIVRISAKYGDNIDKLKGELGKVISRSCIEDSEIRSYGSTALDIYLKKAVSVLEASIERVKANYSLEFISEDVKTVLNELGNLTASMASDDILNGIFSRFCIGK